LPCFPALTATLLREQTSSIPVGFLQLGKRAFFGDRDSRNPLQRVRGEKVVNRKLDESYKSRAEIERADRLDLRVPLRYRLEGHQDWSPGETVNLSETGVLFSTAQTLELNVRVEITFQTAGVPLVRSGQREAHVVRRVLNNWPETSPVFGARFYN
jgi:PilZ domain-containing protein